MLDQLAYLYGFNLKYAEKLVKDVSPEQMAQQPGGVIQPPGMVPRPSGGLGRSSR